MQYLKGTGPETFAAFDGVWEATWDRRPAGADQRAALLTICSHAKPYSKSYIHQTIRRRIWAAGMLDKVDYIHISSAGIVPSWADMDPAFCAYDWNVAEASEADVAYHVATTTRRLRQWFDGWGKDYRGVVSYLRPEGHSAAAVAGCGRPIIPVQGIRPASPRPYALAPDIDEVLISSTNISSLILTLDEVLSK